jgi:hypothetical protein
MVTLPDINVGSPSLMFPADLSSKQQGHFMKIQIFPSKIGSEKKTETIFLFIPGGNQNGPLMWEMIHEYDDVKLARLGTGVVGAITRMIPGYGEQIAGAASNIGGKALGAARVAGLGTINPKVDVLYGNSELRQFNFSFFMSPQSKKETESLKSIVKTLRKFSAPEIATLDQIASNLPGQIREFLPDNLGTNFNSPSGQGSQLKSGLWFIPPAEFQISFHSISDNGQGGLNAPENPYIPKIGRCVLNKVVVDYTQQGDFSTFTDGAPTNLQLTMSFREMRIISQADVDNGY